MITHAELQSRIEALAKEANVTGVAVGISIGCERPAGFSNDPLSSDKIERPWTPRTALRPTTWAKRPSGQTSSGMNGPEIHSIVQRKEPAIAA